MCIQWGRVHLYPLGGASVSRGGVHVYLYIPILETYT
jgi:hypothetical protein